MKVNMNFETERTIRLICLLSCLAFLIAHITYFIYFLVIKVDSLMYINIGSSLFYVTMFLVLKYRLYSTYVILTALEIAGYMFTGTIILGMSAGFHLCLIALCTLIFFAGYFSKSLNYRIKPLFFSIINFILYIIAYIVVQKNGAITIVKELYLQILYFAHILIVFGFAITFLAYLTNYTVKLENKVKAESETDKLTNISNRKGLAKYYDIIGDQKKNYIVAIFDIDNFKKFNDVNGHLCGDYVLKEIANIAKNNSSDDFVSRWGGEEFVIISKIDENIEDTYNKIDNIRKTIEEYKFKYKNKSLKSTITVGVAKFEDDSTLEDWITRADKKLYYGKHHGKNQMVI